MSMAMTLSPAVCRAQRERLVSRLAFAGGVFTGAFATYALFRGLIKEALPIGPYAPPAVLAVAAWASARDLGYRVPVPYINRQVPEWFRSLFTTWVTSGLYGALLGLGFVTKFTYGVHMVLILVLALTVPPGGAVVALAAYSALRVVNTFVGGAEESAGDLTERLHRLRERDWVLRPMSIALSVCLAAIAITTL
jgi:hypothetical protein